MFNTRESRNIVLTFQSTPPFLVENLLAIALAILMAAPLILRIHRFLENRNNNQILSTVRELNSKFQYRDKCLPIRAIRSTPNLNQSEFWITKSKNEMPPKDDNDDSDSDKSLDKFDIYNYNYYRYKLIGEKLTKQYGLNQAPGEVIFNSLHLNSIDSNTGIRLNKRYEHNFFDCVDSYFRKKNKNMNNGITLIHPRDYFLTKIINKRPDTFDKAIDTTVSTIEIDHLPEMISPKAGLKTPSKVSRKQKGSKAKPDNKFNKFSKGNEMLKKTIDFESNSRPSSPFKEAKSISNESSISEKISKVKEPIKKNPFTRGNPFVFTEATKKVSYLRKPRELTNIQDDTENKNFSNEFDKNLNNEKNLTKGKSINENKVETNKFQNNTESININKPLTITVLPEKEKFLSSVANDVFNSSNSYSSRPQSRRSRPSSSGTSSRAFKHFMPKVNSRPRSSGSSFAWEVPDDSGKIWSLENSNEPKPTSTTRPKSANPAISRKKSVAAMSVLESIIDLTCNVTIDTQDSFTTMGVDEIKQRLENSELPLELKHSFNFSRDNRNSKLNSKSIEKPKINYQIPTIPKTKPVSKISPFPTNQSIISGQKKSYLQARSGKYSIHFK
ncbi:uncharacterized protein [Chelonus insularis]|uniref:uncharacterized protein n=1 Tax=Chelonus insularis TaxID=460826 RepID=UPI0015890FBA|nr:uncharacterized protein LOC118064633 [Chelonus insularis]